MIHDTNIDNLLMYIYVYILIDANYYVTKPLHTHNFSQIFVQFDLYVHICQYYSSDSRFLAQASTRIGDSPFTV